MFVVAAYTTAGIGFHINTDGATNKLVDTSKLVANVCVHVGNKNIHVVAKKIKIMCKIPYIPL